MICSCCAVTRSVISVCARSELPLDLWVSSPPLSAHLGCPEPDSGAEGPVWLSLQSAKTKQKPNEEKPHILDYIQ